MHYYVVIQSTWLSYFTGIVSCQYKTKYDFEAKSYSWGRTVDTDVQFIQWTYHRDVVSDLPREL